MRFNSLQTGKHIQSVIIIMGEVINRIVSIPFKRESIYKDRRTGFEGFRGCVSIPFKRESIYKAIQRWLVEMETPVEFQFPSNGKAYTKGRIEDEFEEDC